MCSPTCSQFTKVHSRMDNYQFVYSLNIYAYVGHAQSIFIEVDNYLSCHETARYIMKGECNWYAYETHFLWCLSFTSFGIRRVVISLEWNGINIKNYTFRRDSGANISRKDLKAFWTGSKVLLCYSSNGFHIFICAFLVAYFTCRKGPAAVLKDVAPWDVYLTLWSELQK